MNTNRKPAGLPTGGQFANKANPEPGIALDVDEVDEAQRWRDAGFFGVAYRWWRDAGFDPEEARDWADYDFGIDEAQRYRDAGCDPYDASVISEPEQRRVGER